MNAQAPRGFYLTAGLKTTTLTSDDLLSDSGLGYKAGVNFNWGYHENFNYQIEILYDQSTVDLLTVDENYEAAGKTKFNSNSVDVGFYFNYYLLKPDEDQFFLGLQIGGSTSFSGERSYDGGNTERYLPYLLSEVNLADVSSINYAAGIGVTGGYNDFRFDLRYTHGLNNYLKDVQTNSYDEFNRYTGPELEGKLSSISFSISYRINKLFGGE